MLRAARQARRALPEAARTRACLLASMTPDGAFPDRGGRSDLYYTAFGVQALAALEADLPEEPLRRYLARFGDGGDLDLVHAACLARCWVMLGPPGPPPDVRSGLAAHLRAHQASDGGYGMPGLGVASAGLYAAFLAVGAWEDLGTDVPQAPALARAIRRATAGPSGDGAAAAFWPTPVLAAGVVVLCELGETAPASLAAAMLARRGTDGGFAVGPGLAAADLLSTATALHALAAAGAALDALRADGRRFVLSLRDDGGGFRGSHGDTQADAEFTFYGLLALGCLAET